jgi:hypothetical protein
MFGDAEWDETRSWHQEQRFNRWLQDVKGKRLVAVECGAGTGVPTVRHLCEYLVRTFDARLLRVNVREPQGPAGAIGLAMGALDALRASDERLGAFPG